MPHIEIMKFCQNRIPDSGNRNTGGMGLVISLLPVYELGLGHGRLLHPQLRVLQICNHHKSKTLSLLFPFIIIFSFRQDGWGFQIVSLAGPIRAVSYEGARNPQDGWGLQGVSPNGPGRRRGTQELLTWAVSSLMLWRSSEPPGRVRSPGSISEWTR